MLVPLAAAGFRCVLVSCVLREVLRGGRGSEACGAAVPLAGGLGRRGLQ